MYEINREFDYQNYLKEAIINEWEMIPLQTLKILAISVADRCVTCIEKHGRETGY